MKASDMELQLVGLSPIPVEIKGYACEEFQFESKPRKRLWHRIIKVEVGVTTFEVETRQGMMVNLPIKQGSKTYEAINSYLPCVESPFSAG